MLKIKFDRLDYQELAVNSISDVFKNIAFKPNDNKKSNPSFDLQASKSTLVNNITKVRELNKVNIGDTSIKDELVIDTLMETGTGKTFTFLESIYRLNRDYGLCKFIILVPSNPIRQGTIKNINITKEFFTKEYGKQISVYNYSEKTVLNYINASSQNISVLVSTYQSFNKATNSINKNKIEQTLIGRSRSYMQAIGHLRPVIIIDEPHRFEGKQTAKYLKEFNALFTLRFGATFKGDEYKNLIYTLDSVDAFSRGLVKAITVDTVGNENVDNHTIGLKEVKGTNQKDYVAKIEYKDINFKPKPTELKHGENLGEKVGIEYLNSYIVEKITKNEVIFTNGISILLGESESYGVLLDEMQKVIVDTAIKNHFEREEELFKLNIKSLCLFFIDRVDKYLTDEGINGKLALLFETLYLKNLEQILKKDNLDEDYKKYLLKTKDSVKEVHSGYFAKSKKEGDEAEAIELILNKKEELLSFDSDLRFIFSQWALQEGWDNPNVMTLCKLAPSNSEISKLQQIGRGLRLAVNQEGKRITRDDSHFEFVNELFVVVPSTESDFVSSIQKEISQNSVRQVSKLFNEDVMTQNHIASTPRAAVKLLDELEEKGFITIDEDDMSEISISKEEYSLRSKELELLEVKGCDSKKLKEYFDSFFKTSNRIKAKDRSGKKDKGKIKIHQENFKKFKALWDNLNYDAVVKYDIDSDTLIKSAIVKIDANFEINGQDIIIKRDKNVEDKAKHDNQNDTVTVETHSIFTLYEFIKALANNTKLSMQTIAKVLGGIQKEKFELIPQNENVALKKIEEQLISAIYETIINKISYDLKEIRANNLGEFILEGSLGGETYKIKSKNVRERSIYDEDFMEVDSKIEKTTIDESTHKQIIVFGKLPKVNIPTAHGRHYNPDFGYVIETDDKKELYFVVETKGYDTFSEISDKEKLQIKSAEAFFKKLREMGVNVEYQTKLNSPGLSQIISDILKNNDL
ncbi:restriction endonuclease [Aliarcobacter thereius]|uniref:Type III restriction enzyme, res subunit n=1 Tax=Aliarcobacter thereius LMG 24486 TaxID=1032240 RepID=A0A1C7WPQ0_9BACT|nr:DEAD/DEAH box helicase family protein [Aliarcobacter thereius]OCL90614.1 Type III restriction enzyme, res subunit [Aliarcobacter thereius]OCL95619.1 Type III restriction enzyme, res subunit [Aliarcobacter thereius LMG 24486]QBF16394.1 type III restriction/modification system, res subunit [Aliarcobacter thereius LMG 24486]TLS91454.1 DEAD/DEAH box helicase [Aliarcobacter thereius]